MIATAASGASYTISKTVQTDIVAPALAAQIKFDTAAQRTGARGVVYSNSPLLASKTPLWRGHFLVALCGLGACVLVGRAVYIQIIGTDFYQLEG
ncbi:MAG: hypothetical protein EBS62_09985, partial [Betaproteobacteria bacterium]|nr:hypothetical protein [Betaproteobacteria bacterium]